MPAIQPTRLKHQVVKLGESYRQPDIFIRILHHLLDGYADRTYRPGQTGKPAPLLKAYNSPSRILQQIGKELTPLIIADQISALELCDALWNEPYLEFHLLAASLIGKIPPTPAEPILQRINNWVKTGPEDKILDTMFKEGLSSLRHDTPSWYLKLCEGWLTSSNISTQLLGFRAIMSLMNEPPLETLPGLFKILTPYIRVAPPAIRPYLIMLLRQLIRCSPHETAYLLRQNLGAPDNPDTTWIIRQLLDEFPVDIQGSLRAAQREKQ
jgi:hypothetical protein